MIRSTYLYPCMKQLAKRRRSSYHSSYRYQSNNSKSQQSSSSQQQQHQRQSNMSDKNKIVAYYMAAIAMSVFGLSYASVPLYKVFCAMTGFGGTTRRVDEPQALTVKPVENGKIIRIDFTSNVHSSMPWTFTPTQKSVRVIPGETALAFYTVKNPTNKTITGVATYNVYPAKAGLYFNKVQCFCFEEQRLGPDEEIDMPVFFYIDPEIVDDPAMKNVSTITLAYTFFKTGEDVMESSKPVASIPSNVVI